MDWKTVILLGLIVLLLFVILILKLKEAYKQRVIKKRFQRGNKLEAQARMFLLDQGYSILEEQSPYMHEFYVNGEKRSVKLILDYVVRKNGKKYIVEVKSGNSAISLSNPNSRRQLLEYDFVIKNDGVFLLDMENKNMQLVTFTPKAAKQNQFLYKTMITIAITGIFIPYWQAKVAASVLLVLFLWMSSRQKN